jgi:hypothetical protein
LDFPVQMLPDGVAMNRGIGYRVPNTAAKSDEDDA